MNLIILISFLVVVCVNCELAKQSSELNYVVAKPETNIIPSILPVNLVKYGQYAGYPIQKLTFGPNMAYNKPVLNYINHKHYYPSLPLTINHIGHARKIHSPNYLPHSDEIIVAHPKFQHPILYNSNYHIDHLKRNPALIESIHPSDLHMVSDHHNYLNPIIDHFSPVKPLNHLNEHSINRHHVLNPHFNGHLLNNKHHEVIAPHLNEHLINRHHVLNPHFNGHLLNNKHHEVIAPHLNGHLINKHHDVIAPHLNGNLIDKHHNHIKEHDAHPIISAPFVASYPSIASSFVKYANPISHTSYFMKINHVIPETKHHHAYKTELPFFEANHKLPVQYANHFGLDPNYHIQTAASDIKK